VGQEGGKEMSRIFQHQNEYPKLNVEPQRDYVIIEGIKIEKRSRFTPEEWVDIWYKLQSRQGGI